GGMASAIGKLFTGDFKGALADAKDGVMNLASLNPIAVTGRLYKNVYDQGKKTGELFNQGMMEGVAQVATNKLEEKGAFSMFNNSSVDANSLINDKDKTKATTDIDPTAPGGGKGSGSGSSKTITMHL